MLPCCVSQEERRFHRVCVKFRKVNDLTKKDAHPLPRIDDTLDTLGGAQWFSTIDLASGYWQVHPDNREKTAFPTPDGLHQMVPICTGKTVLVYLPLTIKIPNTCCTMVVMNDTHRKVIY